MNRLIRSVCTIAAEEIVCQWGRFLLTTESIPFL